MALKCPTFAGISSRDRHRRKGGPREFPKDADLLSGAQGGGFVHAWLCDSRIAYQSPLPAGAAIERNVRVSIMVP